MKNKLQQLLQEILKDIGVSDAVPDVSICEDPAHGEYTTNVAMRIAARVKSKEQRVESLVGKSPMDIALQVQSKILDRRSQIKAKNPDQNSSKQDQTPSTKKETDDLLQAIDRVEVAKPGFINVFLSEAAFSTQIQEVLKQKERFGTSKSDQPARVTVEFTDPNPFKEFHIGHLYSNSVGESVCRILESQGHTVRRVNYQGDVGMHVAKALYGLQKIENLKTKMEELEKKSLPDRAKFLGAAYAVGAKAFEEDKAAAEEIGQINKLGFIAAQAMWVKEKGIESVIDYKKGAQIDQMKLDELSRLYITGRSWSLEYFETIYKRLGTAFEGLYFESFVGERGAKIVLDHVSDGIFEASDGAIIYRGEKKGLHTRVFINALGLPTYEAKELGLAPTKHDDWAYDLSIIVTGNEINEYFKVLLAALADVAPQLAEKTRHMGHGMVKKSDGSKMSSRSGMVLTGEGLLDEVKVSIYDLLDKNKSKYDKVMRDEIAEKAAVAAVKYSLLRVSLPSDVAFDLKTSVSFDGDSGPYLLYTYARCQSVLRKATLVAASDSEAAPLDVGIAADKRVLAMTMNPEEKHIARLIGYFSDVAAGAASDYAPNVICTYLFDLAQAFNGFYQKHSILDGDSKVFRLQLTAATGQVLKNGLHLLGIETVEQM